MQGLGAITTLGSILILLLLNMVHLSRRLQFIGGIVVPLVLSAIYALLFEKTPILLLLISSAFMNIAVLIGLYWIWRFLHSKAKWLSFALAAMFFLVMWNAGRLDLFTVTITALLIISEEVRVTPPFFPKVFETFLAEGQESPAGRKAFLVMNLFILLFFVSAAGFAEHLGASKWISILLQIPAWIGAFFVFTSIQAITSERRG